MGRQFFDKRLDEAKAKSRGVRFRTLGSYKSHIEIHLKPFYGETPITKINLDLVEKFIADCEEREVSVATTRKILRTIGAIMDYASKKKYIRESRDTIVQFPCPEAYLCQHFH